MKLLSVTAVALALLASAPAMAAPATQTKTSTLTVGGTIGAVCTLDVLLDPAAALVDLRTPKTGVFIGSVASQCNISSNGYNLDVTTTNASKLTDPNGNAPVSYTINLVATQGNAINSGGYFAADNNSLDIKDIRETSQQRANIFLTTGSTPFAGTYRDTLTFTLTTL
jgi:hypothetical protein